MREMLMFNYHWIPSWLLPMMGSHMSLSNLLPILPSSSFTAPHAFHSIAVNTWSAMYKVVQRQWYWPWTRSFLCLSSLASLKGNFHTQFPMQWKNNMTTKVESSNSCGTPAVQPWQSPSISLQLFVWLYAQHAGRKVSYCNLSESMLSIPQDIKRHSTSSTSSALQSMEWICPSIGHWHGTVLPISSLCSMSRRCLWRYHDWLSLTSTCQPRAC